jgi:hypothetical protein
MSFAFVLTPAIGPHPSSPAGGSSSVKRKLPHFLQNFFPASYSMLHLGQITMVRALSLTLGFLALGIERLAKKSWLKVETEMTPRQA